MTPPKGSMSAYLIGEEVAQALLNQGATIEQLRQLKKRSDIAKALAGELQKMLQPETQIVQPLEEAPSASMLIRLEDSELARRECNALLRAGLEFIGDLTITSKLELLAERGIGHTSVQHIEDVLAADGLRLRKHSDDAFTHAVRIYGKPEEVPARLMWLWAPHARVYVTTQFLRRAGTLLQLAQCTRLEFVEAYRRYHGTEDDTRGVQQAAIIEQGLSRAGLAFLKGEE